MRKIQLSDTTQQQSVKDDGAAGAASGCVGIHIQPSFDDDDDDDGVDVHDDFEFDAFGFTEDEVLELAAQGITPTDPEAREVLDMLKGGAGASGDY